MRRFKILAGFLSILLIPTVFVGCIKHADSIPTPIESEVITFTDENLEIVIRETLGKSVDEEILATELVQLTKLSIIDNGVLDLTGLEYCTNLTFLEIRNDPITDISSLSLLTNLNYLHLCDNQISDISPLSGLVNLKLLAIAENPVSDLSPLSKLTNLTILDLAGDEISDISPLASLANLTILCLQGNKVSNISHLAGLTNLVDLRLTQNQVEDISPLLDNPGLGKKDSVLLGGNKLDLYQGSEDMENIKILEARGVIISLDPNQWAPEELSPNAPRPQESK